MQSGRQPAAVKRAAEAALPTMLGKFRIIAYESGNRGTVNVALVMGKVRGKERVLARLHSQCLTGDVFHSQRCDCGEQLSKAMGLISKEGRGIVVYLAQEGRGIGLANKIRAYALQENGHDTVEANRQLGFRADERDYSIAAGILKDLGVGSIRLLTNNPDKITGLNGSVRVAERVPLLAPKSRDNERYLEAKKQKLGHLL